MPDARNGGPATVRWWRRLSMWWNVDDGGDPFASEIPDADRLRFHRAVGSRYGLAGMNQREQDEFLIVYGSRGQRKAAKARKKAREAAKKRARDERRSGLTVFQPVTVR